MTSFIPDEVDLAKLLLLAITEAAVTKHVWILQQNDVWARYSLDALQEQLKLQIDFFLNHGYCALLPSDIVLNEIAVDEYGTLIDIVVGLSEISAHKLLLRFHYGRCLVKTQDMLRTWHIPFGAYSFEELATIPNPYTTGNSTTLFQQVWADIVRKLLKDNVQAQEKMIGHVKDCLIHLLGDAAKFDSPLLYQEQEAQLIAQRSKQNKKPLPPKPYAMPGQPTAELQALERQKQEIEAQMEALRKRALLDHMIA